VSPDLPQDERRALLERNLRVYPLFQAIAFTPVMLPVIVLFWEENGLDLFDVFALQGIFAVAVVLLEVPTGMVADRLGKRASLLGATALLSLGMLIYALSHGFGLFLLAEIVFALGAAMLSGADSSLLYDSLKALGRQEDYKRLEGRARAMQMMAFAGCNLLGGVIGSYSYRATVWVSLVGPLIGFLVAWRFTEVQHREASSSMADALRGYRDLMTQAARFVRKHALVRWQIGFLAVLTGSATWLLWLYQPYMQLVGLPVWAFGVAFAGFGLFAAAASSVAHRIDDRFGQRGTLILLMMLQIAPPLLMAIFVHPAGVLLILGHQAVRAVARPIIGDRLLRYTWADKRSTVLSIASLASRLFFAATALIIGVVAKVLDLPGVLLFQGLALAVLLNVMWLLYRRIPPKYFAVKHSVVQKQ
jgi:MFS family permease